MKKGESPVLQAESILGKIMKMRVNWYIAKRIATKHIGKDLQTCAEMKGRTHGI